MILLQCLVSYLLSNLCSTLSGVGFQACCSLAMWPWDNNWTPRCLSFFMCEMEILPSQAFLWVERKSASVSCSEWSSACFRLSALSDFLNPWFLWKCGQYSLHWMRSFHPWTDLQTHFYLLPGLDVDSLVFSISHLDLWWISGIISNVVSTNSMEHFPRLSFVAL